MITTRQNHPPTTRRGVLLRSGGGGCFPCLEGSAGGFGVLAGGRRVVRAGGFLLGIEPRRVVAGGIWL
jgi:hypothetical protein